MTNNYWNGKQLPPLKKQPRHQTGKLISVRQATRAEIERSKPVIKKHSGRKDRNMFVLMLLGFVVTVVLVVILVRALMLFCR